MSQLPRLPIFRKSTPQGYFEAKTGDFNKFPRQTHTCDLQYQSFTSPFISLSLNIRIYCSNVVTCPVLKLQSQRWEIQRHQYTTELTILPSHYLKFINLNLQNFVVRPRSRLFWVKATFHCNHATYLTHLDTAYLSSQFVCHHLSFSFFYSRNTFEWVYLHTF